LSPSPTFGAIAARSGSYVTLVLTGLVDREAVRDFRARLLADGIRADRGMGRAGVRQRQVA
jgi:hypothetical protein